MPEIPECLNRRYLALDELIKDLTSTMSNRSSNADCPCESTIDVGIKLMCDFWNILKEDPNCDLTQAVQQRMGLDAKSNNLYGPRNATCYMAGPGSSDDDDDKKRCAFNKIKNLRCRSPEPESKPKCCTSKLVSSSGRSNVLPLSKVLCNLKEAASFDKKCNVRLNELMETEKQLRDQIQNLENRENKGIQLIKQADCMWSCMEDVYKTKLMESLERQKVLLKQLKEVEASTTKWRKNKKDLEFQISNINKCQQEITEKINQKSNDLKFIDMEITEFNKRIENNKKEIETAKKSLTNKKQASDLKIATITANITELQKKLSDEQKHKYEKEQEGNKYIKEAREDLQTICRVLLQKKLENEDKKAEREAILLELDMLKQTCDVCREKCQNKHIFINEEIKNIDKEIAEFKVKCIRCHECTDTADVRKFCTDCPRCLEERDCLYADGHCDLNHSMDCVCMSIKQKFLDNIFDNMYTVLEKQAQTDPGKAVADTVLRCLKRSRNGKLNDETKKILQDFILTTVKKNLNLTIVGGAVKTRCEMDPETYKQLMLCLKQVKVTQPPKVDAETAAKKDPCRRWGGTSECNCPKGPNACICTKNAPPPPDDHTPCSPQDKEDISEVVACPHKDGASCVADCASHAHPSCVDTDVAAWRPNPCQEQTCTFSKNMQAAQCFLGPDSSSSLSKLKDPNLPDISMLSDKIMCNCENDSKKLCTRHEDSKHMKAIQVEKQYNPGLENVILKIKAENNYSKYIEGRLLKTISGNIAISFNTISILNTKFNKTKEFPVLLHKSDSDTLLIDIDQELINETTNAILRKTSNEKMLVVIADTMFNIDKDKINFEQNAKFYKMRIKGINNEVEPPVVLKLTPSDNYITVIDKEFEKKYRHTIGISIDENYKCTLVRSNSGNYEIAFEDCSISQETQNAFIVKSPSGNIKILVNGPDFEAITKRTSELSPDAVDCKSFDEILRKLLDKLPSSSLQLNKEKVKKSKFLGITSSSNSCLYEKVKFRLENNQSLLTESSALLKRIRSGQYAVVLNKESKKKLINNIKSYLVGSSQNMIPIKRTESSEITIILNNDDKVSDQYGSLKITSSGNIYVLVNEEVVKDIKKYDMESKYKDDSQYIIGSIKNSVDKAVATTCNSKPDDNFCVISKCICKDLQFSDSFESSEIDKDTMLFRPELCGTDWRKVKKSPKGRHKICDPGKCKEKYTNNKKRIEINEKAPHIVIKPCESRLVSKQYTQRCKSKKCFYFTDSICSYHKDRYINVSNELLEISGLCNKGQKSNSKLSKDIVNSSHIEKSPGKVESFNSNQFAYLDNLPPQLPSFLKGYHYNI